MQIDEFLVYVDSSIIIVNKPSGLRTIPDGYQKNLPNLQTLLKEKFSSIFTIHRLDKETSGLIIFGRNKLSHRNLNIQFEQKLIDKTYHALVHNIPEWDVYTIDQPLLIDGDRKHRTVINPNGKSATTFLRKVEVNNDNHLSFLDIHPKTGYTHQIRSHLNHLGFPILGDQLYSLNLSTNQNQMNKSVSRMMLHA
ncbi:MAG TPA: RluA family pseudouridine synthase, partial [Anaerolineaceae bacterium]|nr:RluA family pseudouridine synthase [Anaerolineaceae bacterium]